MSKSQETFQKVAQHFRETALLSSAEEALNWDERTRMPPKAGPYRAEQVTFLAGLVHARRTDPRVGEWLAELAESDLAADRHSDHGATIHELRRDYDKRTKLPQRLVEELARTAVLGQQAWVEARKKNDFASFAPLLEKTYDLKREQAEAVGYAGHRYDALLDDFEPRENSANVGRVLRGLREELVPLVEDIMGSSHRPDESLFRRRYPIDVQESFGTEAAKRLGFDFDSGRLDVTAHPFCTTLGPYDIRILTRYDEHFFQPAFFGILHEAGHGIYEQGLRPDWFGLPPGEAISLGIHESQSRMWENLVGRSRSYWQYHFPLAQRAFPEALGAAALDDFYFAANEVRPSLIRVEADEATYNLHILVRFDLELALVSGDLPVRDVPGAWREKYRSYLGVEPKDDADGCLQDIHWSAGLIGYFATYSLGNLYAAQFFEQADQDLGGLSEQFARGDFRPLREWLREKIHTVGRCYSAAELVQKVTGRPLRHEPLMRYLRGKLGPLYRL
jgi:carboxypeptidase Taq